MSLNCEPKLAHFMPKLARVATLGTLWAKRFFSNYLYHMGLANACIIYNFFKTE